MVKKLHTGPDANKDTMATPDRAFDAMIASMQDPEAKAAISAMMSATPETLRDAAAEYRKHEADMYRVMDEPHEGILRTVLEIMDSWELSVADRLNILRCNQTMYNEWTKDPDLMIISSDPLLRMSYLLRIWETLNTLFPDQEQARAWLHHPNNALSFKGSTPLSMMTEGKKSDLLHVWQFLDEWILKA